MFGRKKREDKVWKEMRATGRCDCGWELSTPYLDSHGVITPKCVACPLCLAKGKYQSVMVDYEGVVDHVWP